MTKEELLLDVESLRRDLDSGADLISEECLDPAIAGMAPTHYDLHSYDNPERAAVEIALANDAVGGHSNPIKNKMKIDWLPFAAEKMGISPNLKDYVITPVVIMASDLPNRNLVAFPFSVLTEWDPHLGMLCYQTFRGKALQIDHHDNMNYERASGIVLDVGLQPMKNVQGKLYRVVALVACDRNRNPKLANDIVTGAVTMFSMGAVVRGYECSICGTKSVKPTEPKCFHVPANRRELRAYPKNGKRWLAYYNVGPFRGFEVSALVKALPPAFPSAEITKNDIIQF